MEKIKRFITCLVPAHTCNFRCTYCYLSHHSNSYYKGINPLVMKSEKICKSMSIKRMGGSCYFNLCADGETMMHPEVIDLIYCLTHEGHYVDLVTNGTLTRKFEELINKLDIKQRKRVFIKFSFHFLELRKHNMLCKFVANVNKIKNAKISYTIEITPHDELIPYINEVKEFSIKEFGALPHITVARNEGVNKVTLLTKYSREEYKKIWSVFDSDLFDFKFSIFNQNRREFCYAGVWSLAVNLEDGYFSQCYKGDTLGNICDLEKPIIFRAIGRCKEPHCFNGHAFLGFGDIPELAAPTYAQERDRVTDKGEHWLQPEVKEFFNSKLIETNSIYSEEDKNIIMKKNVWLSYFNKLQRIKKRLFLT